MTPIRYSGTTLAVTLLVLGGFTLAIFLLRLWFRITRRRYDGSDTLLLAAVICAFTHTTIYLLLIFHFHHGKLKADIPPSVRTSPWPAKLLYLNQIIFKLTTPLCKLSLCHLYRTICATATGTLIRRTRTATHLTILLILLGYSSALLVSIFQCTPVRKVWRPRTPGTCISLSAFRYSTAALNVATSLAVILLPIPVLAKLRHQRPQVRQLIGLILLGLLHTSLTVARLVVMFFPDRMVRDEPQYGWVSAQCLAVGEMDANVLFASLVVMRPAFQALGRGLLGRDAEYDDGQGDGGIRSAVRRFAVAWEKRNKKRWSETYILETTRADSVQDVENSSGGLSKTWSRVVVESQSPAADIEEIK